MPYSYNGWYASPSLSIRPLYIAGESFVPGVLDNDDVWTVLHYLANRLHNEVEPIVRADWHQMDDWGFSFRDNRNDPNSLSNHSSGTAFDYNATRHPNGVPTTRTWTAAQINKIHEIISDLPIVWGGDYRGTPDSMHFEIMGSRAAVAAAATRIRNSEKDWFDMATEAELRAIVREVVQSNTPTGADIRRMIQEELDLQAAETVTVRKGDGTLRQVPRDQLLREVWQRLDRHV